MTHFWWKSYPVPANIPQRAKSLVLIAALLAVFLGALDALIIGAAMPTIVSDLGGLELYSWVFSAYMLTRAISLPLFGKLADLYSTKKLFILAVGVFLVGSLLAGAVNSMSQLIFLRSLQGIGAGGNFALAYIVVAEISAPPERGRMMGLISFVWGVSSVLGPLLGGFIVTFFAWPWVFYINVPVGGAAIFCVLRYFQESREKRQQAAIDYLGAFALSTGVLALLFAFLLGGKARTWHSPQILGLLTLTLLAGILFWSAERRAVEPILPLDFFRVPRFTLANGAAFFCSFAVFSLMAFIPLFVQGAMGRSAAVLGLLMVPLSLGWSTGALVCGQLVSRLGEKTASVAGSLLMLTGTGLTLTFSPSTNLFYLSGILFGIGLGMGFVSLSTLLTVQYSLKEIDLGVATSSHQFARTLGGTIGIGITGSLVYYRIDKAIGALMDSPLHLEIPPVLATQLSRDIQNFLRPEIEASLSGPVLGTVRGAIGRGVEAVFWTALLVCLVSVILCLLLPGENRQRS